MHPEIDMKSNLFTLVALLAALSLPMTLIAETTCRSVTPGDPEYDAIVAEELAEAADAMVSGDWDGSELIKNDLKPKGDSCRHRPGPDKKDGTEDDFCADMDGKCEKKKDPKEVTKSYECVACKGRNKQNTKDVHFCLCADSNDEDPCPPTPSPTPEPTETPSPSPSTSATITFTSTPESTPSASASPTPSATVVPTPGPSGEPVS
jgi:hypothetical protein